MPAVLLFGCKEQPVVVDGSIPFDPKSEKTVAEPSVDPIIDHSDNMVIHAEMDHVIDQSKETAALIEASIPESPPESLIVEMVVDKVVAEVVETIDHKPFDDLLRKYVTILGDVNYDGIKGNAEFDRYLSTLSNTPPRETWTRAEKMSYWINAYNAFTIKLILDHLPVASIKDIPSPWKTKFFQIDGKDFDLNTIEHEVLRAQFSDPRIHFAINCASASCPKLLNRAYLPESLERQLAAAARDFINDPKRNVISEDELRLSKIFDWFENDFTKETDLIGYISKYANIPVNADAKVRYLDYDWSLNKN